MDIFLIEAEGDDFVCSGEPCVGWREKFGIKGAFSWIYDKDPRENELQIYEYNGEGQKARWWTEEARFAQGVTFHRKFLELFQREVFEEKWPVLKKAIECQDAAKIEKARLAKNEQMQEARQANREKELAASEKEKQMAITRDRMGVANLMN
ncbi:hypothetical protein BDP27DRAFT_589725 [Rhodocollybia butyracea]|uniref:Uncharacterized protein n=1 Tax=Rhodocollybia butyracea TaxID=206335 RepID=A0A9P5PY22_9AGAR|nr:hypothetical protein BDP27DRAFT_589725 [Rhodocollybia butyracea]